MWIADERPAIEIDRHASRQAVGDLVDALVARRTGVAAHVVPRDAAFTARPHELVEPLPQIAVHHVAARGGLPAALAPAEDPAADALDDISRIGVDGDGARDAADRRKRLDRPGQLHPVV